MSTIVGLVGNHTIWLGADACLTYDDVVYPCSEKLCQINCNLAIAGAGRPRTIEIAGMTLKQHLQPSELNLPQWREEFRHAIAEAGQMMEMDAKIQVMQADLLIATNKGLFVMLEDFMLYEVQGFTAYGSGKAFALGALAYADADPDLSGERLVNEAIQIAARFDSHTRPPVTVVKIVRCEECSPCSPSAPTNGTGA